VQTPSIYHRTTTLTRRDGRTAVARRLKTIRADLLQFLGRTPSVVDEHLLKRAGVLTLVCERYDDRLLAGEDLSEHAAVHHIAAQNSLVRTLQALGLRADAAPADPAAKPPSLADYLASRAQETAL
jgi:hypothetical protein